MEDGKNVGVTFSGRFELLNNWILDDAVGNGDEDSGDETPLSHQDGVDEKRYIGGMVMFSGVKVPGYGRSVLGGKIGGGVLKGEGVVTGKFTEGGGPDDEEVWVVFGSDFVVTVPFEGGFIKVLDVVRIEGEAGRAIRNVDGTEGINGIRVDIPVGKTGNIVGSV